MGKQTKLPPPAEKAMSSRRKASSDMPHQDEKRASSGDETTGGSTNCDLGLSPQQSRLYLSLEQMPSLQHSTKVNLDVSHLVGKDCTIYSDALNVLGCVHALKLFQVSTPQKEMRQILRQLDKKIKHQDPDALFHRMNCGTEADLLGWQQFSFVCLSKTYLKFALEGTPFQIWVDDGVLPQAKRIARERARLDVLLHMSQNTDSQMGKAMRIPTGPAPTLHELGDDDIVLLDMEELAGRQMVVPTRRVSVQFLYNVWRALMAIPLSHRTFTAMYKERLSHLQDRKLDSETYSISSKMSYVCVEIAVLGRLLYGKPIRVQQTEANCVQDYECSTEDELAGMCFFPEPSTEMLCPIVIPDSVAGKGGYIVAGEFRPGHGIETVHLKFSDFKSDDVIVLHPGNELETNLLLISYVFNKTFIDSVIQWKKEGDEHIHDLLSKCVNSLHSIPGDPLFVHELQLGGLEAHNQLGEVYQHRMLVPSFRQALHGTPARLFYTSDHSACTEGSWVIQYLNRVRELCVKKLGDSSGACV